MNNDQSVDEKVIQFEDVPMHELKGEGESLELMSERLRPAARAALQAQFDAHDRRAAEFAAHDRISAELARKLKEAANSSE